jgi:hypothetical protein
MATCISKGVFRARSHNQALDTLADLCSEMTSKASSTCKSPSSLTCSTNNSYASSKSSRVSKSYVPLSPVLSPHLLTFNHPGPSRSLWGPRKLSIRTALLIQPLRVWKHLTPQRAKHADPHRAGSTACRVQGKRSRSRSEAQDRTIGAGLAVLSVVVWDYVQAAARPDEPEVLWVEDRAGSFGWEVVW